MARQEAHFTLPVENQFAEKYAKPGYKYGFVIERYEGEEQADVEKRVGESVTYNEWYIDWEHVKPLRQTSIEFLSGEQAAKVRQKTISRIFQLQTVRRRLGEERISQHKKVIELGTVFYK